MPNLCRLVSYCPRHCTPKPQMSGVRLVSKEEAAKQTQPKGDDGNGLWNAQLFPPPQLVPVPDCASGCARFQPIQVKPPSACFPRVDSNSVLVLGGDQENFAGKRCEQRLLVCPVALQFSQVQ